MLLEILRNSGKSGFKLGLKPKLKRHFMFQLNIGFKPRFQTLVLTKDNVTYCSYVSKYAITSSLGGINIVGLVAVFSHCGDAIWILIDWQLVINTSQPVYPRSSLHTHHSTRSLRLSNTNLLCAPFVCTSFGSHSFSVAAPKIWNSLPPALRMCTSHDTFRHQLKTHYFQLAFQPT